MSAISRGSGGTALFRDGPRPSSVTGRDWSDFTARSATAGGAILALRQAQGEDRGVGAVFISVLPTYTKGLILSLSKDEAVVAMRAE